MNTTFITHIDLGSSDLGKIYTSELPANIYWAKYIHWCRLYSIDGSTN